MGCSTTVKEECCDGRRGNTKSDLAICTNGSRDGVADVGLSTASSAMKEKEVSFIILCRVDDLIKGEFLLRVEMRIAIIDKASHVLWVISQLLLEKMIGNQDVPILLGKGHVRIVVKK